MHSASVEMCRVWHLVGSSMPDILKFNITEHAEHAEWCPVDQVSLLAALDASLRMSSSRISNDVLKRALWMANGESVQTITIGVGARVKRRL